MKNKVLCWIIVFTMVFPFHHAKAQTDESWLMAYLQPGETAVTLENGLVYEGKLYRLHYFTTGSQRKTDIAFLANIDPAQLKKQEITALLLSSDGQVVWDEETCEKILTLYKVAYHLYRNPGQPYFGDAEGYNQAMQNYININVIENLERFVKDLFGNRTNEYTEAMRGILTPQLEMPDPLKNAAQTTARTLTLVDNFGEAGEAGAKALVHYRPWRSVMNRFINKYTSVSRGFDQGRVFYQYKSTRIDMYNALNLVDVAVKTIWTADLAHERLDLLTGYMNTGGGTRAFNSDMNTAYGKIALEVENDWFQRGDIVLQFIDESGAKLATGLAVKEFQKLYYDKVVDLAVKKGMSRLVLYNVAHYLSLAAAGYVIGDALFGVGAAYENFAIGTRTNEFRLQFKDWRTKMYQQYNQANVENFDGEVLSRYRAAYLLEAYASARVVRLYADGAGSTVHILINKDEIQNIRKLSFQIEMDAEEAVGYPSFVPEALRLSANRQLVLQLTVDNLDNRFQTQGSAANFKTMNTGYAGQAVWTLNETSTSVNAGKWGISIPEAGRYLVLVYLPQPPEDLEVEYTASAAYAVHHAGGETGQRVDQARNAGKWVELGIYPFAMGENEGVWLSDQTSEAKGERAVVFDAVRYIPEDRITELARDAISPVELIWEEESAKIRQWIEDLAAQIGYQVDAWWQQQKARVEQWLREQAQAWLDRITAEIEAWLVTFFNELLANLGDWVIQLCTGICGMGVAPLAIATGVAVRRRSHARKREVK